MAMGHGEGPGCSEGPPLRIEQRACGSAIEVDIAGEIDAASSRAFAEGLLAAAEAGTGPVVVNLGEVSFLDSSGLHALVDARQLAGSRLRLGTVNPVVRRVLEMTSLLSHLEPSDGPTDAG